MPFVIVLRNKKCCFRDCQATLIGGGGGILKYPPQKNLSKIHPQNFWKYLVKTETNEEN